MATIYIDNLPYEVDGDQNLLHACLSLGFNLPYFCWHPAMHSVGACRQCAVKQFKSAEDTKGTLVMACMTQAAHGTRISIDDPEAREFRAAVIEFLMVNHPHDCPVCDEGGECHLQDMTMMTGHDYRRYRFKKRTHRNQYLGPFLNHEMNRCIACYRCVRFYQDYAGGRDLDVFQWHNYVYFGRQEDGVLENEFAGNLAEVCPTGVFTDKTLGKHYARKWDLQTAPSICVHCGLGCNTIPGERYGKLRRIRNRYNREVNGYFLCDRGRYGYEFVNSPERIRRPLVKAPLAQAGPVDKKTALERVAAILAGGRAIGIGSPRASLEANFALRTLVGPDRFYCGLSDEDCRLASTAISLLRQGSTRTPTLREVENADAALVLGEDVTNTAPILALALRRSTFNREANRAMQLHIPAWRDAAVREAIQQRRGPLYLATPAATKLDDTATQVYRGGPDDLVRFGQAIAYALAAPVPPVRGLPGDLLPALVDKIAEDLYAASRPVIVSGLGSRSEAVLQAAANVAWALRDAGHDATLYFAFPECNTVGMGLMSGGSIGEACRAVHERKADTLIVLENDLFRRADEPSIRALFDAAKHVIAIDHLASGTTERADVVLPAATFAEGDGTLVNNEGRAQRFYQVFVPEGEIQESWRWVRDVAMASGGLGLADWVNLDRVVEAMAEVLPILAPVPHIAPPADFRIKGMKIARQTHRASGRTAVFANVTVHEPRPPEDPDSPLAFTMEGFHGEPPAATLPRFWAPGWNSIQAITRFQEEVNGPLRGGDPGRRLIEPHAVAQTHYFTDVPMPFTPRAGQWLAVPLYHIFGSEELSMLSPGVAELAPAPYLAIHPEDARRQGWKEGQEVQVTAGGTVRRLPLRGMASLVPGTVGLPAGLPGFPRTIAPRWVEIEALETTGGNGRSGSTIPEHSEDGKR